MKWQLVPVEPTPEMVWKAEEDSPPFHHGDPWYGSEQPSEGQIRAIYTALLEAAPQPEPLSDERIDKICDTVERDNVLFSQSGIYALARAIERELLGENNE